MDIVKKILMVSFVALLAGVGSGHAAIPSTNYVDQGLETKVDDAQIVKSDFTTTVGGTTVDMETADHDTLIPTMAAVEKSFVPNEKVMTAEQAAENNAIQVYANYVQGGYGDNLPETDEMVPSVNTVAHNFVPKVASTVYNRGEVTEILPDGNLPDGSYSLIVEVKDGKITYRWVALQVSTPGGGIFDCDTQDGCRE